VVCVTGRPLGARLALSPVRPDHHDHVAAVLPGLRFHESQFLDVTGEALQQPET
jgi:hypothetical protein